MRVLVGYTAQAPEIVMHRALPGREGKGDDLVAFGNGYVHARPQAGHSWGELLACCPSGWTPDVYIHWSPEYNALPWGWENADCLTVGVFGDWNLGGVAMQQVASGFDVVVADSGGGKRLKAFGHERVEYVPLWALDPNLHRVLPDVERDIDILMVGNFNHAVQWERSGWLARIARLSARYRVLVVTGVYGEAYVQMMNRAKIVFNRSIRGEINMRAYEACACGALMFYERENAEIGSLYRDREECVLYGEDDLDSLLEYYLAPENKAERERIADAGRRRVQTESYAHHFARMLDTIECHVAERKANPLRFQRAFADLPLFERSMRIASQWYHGSDRACFPRLNDMLTGMQKTFVKPNEQTAITAFRGAMYGEWARRLPKQHEMYREVISAGLNDLQRAVMLQPDDITARRNLGMLAWLAGEQAYAEEVLQTTLRQLESADVLAGQLAGAWFPRDFDAFTVAMERVWGEHGFGSAEWIEGIRGVASAQIHFLLAGAAWERAEYADCITYAHEALKRLPHHSQSRLLFADACRAVGQIEAALTAYRQVVDESPFDMSAWQSLASYLLELHRTDEASRLLESIRTLINGAPVYQEFCPVWDTIVNQLRMQQEQVPPKQDGITRLLAFPDWNNTADWQTLVRDFVREYAPSEPTLLMLRAEPSRVPNAQGLLSALEQFLVHDLAMPTLPNITLLTQELGAANEWQLYFIADAVIQSSPSCGFRPELAANLNCPVWEFIGKHIKVAA
jgi:tetratricopeptide (TPR) repeat protein